MKNSLKYFLLWQKKRNELPVSDDPQADWSQMQFLLDEHMPVKKTGGFKGFRTLPAILVTFSAAAMIYIASNIYHLEKHRQAVTHHFRKGSPLRSGPTTTDSSSSANVIVQNDSTPSASRVTADTAGVGDALKSDAKLSANRALAGNSKNNMGLTASKKRKGAGRNGMASIRSGSGSQIGGHTQKAFTANNAGQLHRGSPIRNAYPVPSSRNGSSLPTPGRQIKPGDDNPAINNHDQETAALNTFNNRSVDGTLTQAFPSVLIPTPDLNKIQPARLSRLNSAVNQSPLATGSQTTGNKKGKPTAPQSTKTSNINWGILMGVNTSGSFTPKRQNANFYGSAPLDPYFGLFISYKITDDWAISPQLRLLSPQNIVTRYTHANQSKVDSNQSLMITTSGKMYAVSVPLYAVYNAGNGLSFKAGPVINFPIKQVNTSSIFLPYNIRTDTSYFKNISAILNQTRYQQNINFGFSAGASYQFRRFIFEATYLKSLSGYGINSGLGSFKSYNGTFQFTIGFQLDKVKP